ncbi:D-amino acid dehydrogenase small subunit [Pseudooceanicola marinus]|uniref:D-amino acid dehydrogenase small subunit n=1 Tax=Pseudooceanicola marinus TaxID=396013 RepID=A0A1X6Z4F8_9RHOB|nr:FAD-binding oxidoreductase [Pseudooceanicola marinus]SLN39987.1 D-amino acid dehydrogenase small subunit [Pseudooceanicola marinus]
MSDVIVLGAGMVGTTTALALQARGLDVVLADRREPGRETSYGNAGIIQGEAMEPYALPTNPVELIRLGLGADNAVRWTLGGVLGQAGALLRYLGNSRPARHAAISAIYAQLVREAVARHEPLVEAAGAGNLMRPRGFRQGWRGQRSFDAALADAERVVKTYGIEIEALDGDALARVEPGLTARYAGAIDWKDCWACADPGGLVACYAALFEARGGTVLRADAGTLTRTGAGWRVTGETGPTEAARVVLALGPWTPAALRPFGARVPMVGKRGYHLHFKGERTLNLPFMDTDVSAVMSPMRDGLRVATGAELVPMDAPVNRSQLIKAEARAREMFELGDAVEAEPWFGTRPCLPGMLPVLGEVPDQPGLWAHFGHGHQGFTLGPVTAEILAAAMAGERSEIIAALDLRHALA